MTYSFNRGLEEGLMGNVNYASSLNNTVIHFSGVGRTKSPDIQVTIAKRPKQRLVL